MGGSESTNDAPYLGHRPASIKDIARVAGVSHSTVSRALQNSPLVTAKTVEEIHRIARDLGYRPSAVARGLVTRKTLTIGVVVTTISDPFVSEVVIGIELAANDSGYSVILADSNADPNRENNVVHSFAERRVDGIVITSSRVGALYTPLLSEMMVPIVLINNQHPGQFVHSVMIENLNASREATNHLIGLGHRRIAYVGDQYGHQSDTERFAGYREALEQAALPFLPELVVHGDGKPEGGVLAMNKLAGLAASAHGGILLQRSDGSGGAPLDSHARTARSRGYFLNRLRRPVFRFLYAAATDYRAAADAADGADGHGEPAETDVRATVG